MKPRLLALICSMLFVLPAAGAAPPPAAAPDAQPKLVLLIAVDQMRYDYLTRFGSEFDAGLGQLLAKGAVFTNAHLDHYPSVTAVGHATMLTGAWPSVSGIVGNDWYDRAERKNVGAVEDPGVQLVGGPQDSPRKGSSPWRLRVSTIGDELKLAGRDSRIVGISIKDRSAILMAGRMADAAYWWGPGGFVSSSWYLSELPAWAVAFQKRGLAEAWLGREWRALGKGTEQGALLATLPATPGRDPADAVHQCQTFNLGIRPSDSSAEHLDQIQSDGGIGPQ